KLSSPSLPITLTHLLLNVYRILMSPTVLGMNSIVPAPLYRVFIVPVYAYSPSHSPWPQDGADDRPHHRHGARCPEGRRHSPAGEGPGMVGGPRSPQAIMPKEKNTVP